MKILSHKQIKKEGKVWRWEIVQANKIIAGGYCRTREDAENDLQVWHDLTEPIPPRNPEHDWPTGGYQEECMECKTLFWGERGEAFCKPCAAKEDAWSDCGAEDNPRTKCKTDGCETTMSDGSPELCPKCQGADISPNVQDH